MCANRKNPRTPCIIVHHRGVHQPGVAEAADVELDVGALDPDQRVQPVGLAPAEPAPQLVGVQGVGPAGVAGQEGHRRQLGGRHRRAGTAAECRGTDMCHLTRRPRSRPHHARRKRGEHLNPPAVSLGRDPSIRLDAMRAVNARHARPSGGKTRSPYAMRQRTWNKTMEVIASASGTERIPRSSPRRPHHWPYPADVGARREGVVDGPSSQRVGMSLVTGGQFWWQEEHFADDIQVAARSCERGQATRHGRNPRMGARRLQGLLRQP